MQPYPDKFMIIFKLFGNIENSFLAPSKTLKKSRRAEIPVGQLHFRLCMMQFLGRENDIIGSALETSLQLHCCKLIQVKNCMRFEIKHDWEWGGRCGFGRITNDRLDEDVTEKKSVLPWSITSYCLLWTLMGVVVHLFRAILYEVGFLLWQLLKPGEQMSSPWGQWVLKNEKRI